MDPISVAEMALKLIGLLWGTAQTSGVLGTPDWVKYVDGGLHISQQALQIIGEMKANPSQYDSMTPEQIRALLMPASLEDLTAEAKRQLGLA